MSFSFGTPSSAPATTGLAGGFNFGANKPATPGFGLTATSQPATGLFGSTQSTETPAFGSTGFGATSAAPAFGATTTPAFGTGTPAFGSTSAAPAFGTAAPAFGATAPTNFGATATPAFGASAAPTFGATTAPAFGTTGLGTGGLNFGAGAGTATSNTGLSFGAPASSANTTGLGGLGSFGFNTTATTQSTGFGAFGSTTSTTTTTNTLFGTPSYGLSQVANTSGIGVNNKSEPPKQNKLPNEISTMVDTFKEFVKKQKSLSSEVMRVSVKPLHKVSREAESILREVLSLSGEVSRGRAHSRRLRAAAAAALAAAEAAVWDYTTPGSELEGTAPPAYVKELIAELEQQLITFRRQMDVADKQMQSSPKLLTEQELTLGIRRMHESLVALAGRLQAVHAAVARQKDQYLNLRKYVLKDPTNVFDTPDPSNSLDQILRDAETNKKKMKPNAFADISLGSAVISDPRAALGNLQQLAGPTPFTYIGSTLSPFPTADTSGPNWQPQSQPTLNTSFNTSGFGMTAVDNSSGFQLQKPPGKRGKQ
ncbi:probable nucleoporin Nup58 isoform X2 [Trichoplusia ni]|uniref:Probable nucleoporin Nup58 isoform X2 n=1 Tax=Trichoplusia ni TaxID=7111 RepID=A0A7E5W8C6_TRINI|nr:probable nucleoporin Nup58 isoform X2 [Trichoplusia ni]